MSELLKDEFPAGEPIVAMCTHNGKVFIATARRIFRMREDSVFEPLKFVEMPADPTP